MKSLIEIFKTKKGCVYQCNHSNSFLLDFAGHEVSFKVKGFVQFSRLVASVDLDALILDTNMADVEILNPYGTNKIYALTLCELIALKELIAGAKTMLELNSIIYDRLHLALA